MASRRMRSLELLAQARLVPQELALEQARAGRDVAQQSAWLSALGPLVQGVGSTIGGLEASAARTADAQAQALVDANAYETGPRLVGPLPEGVTERPYAQTPGQLAADATKRGPSNPLDLFGNRERERAMGTAQGRIAGGVAKNRLGIEERDYSRGVTSERMSIDRSNKERDDKLAQTKVENDRHDKLLAQLKSRLAPIVNDELNDDPSGKGAYSPDAQLTLAQFSEVTGLQKDEAEGIYRVVMQEGIEARRKAALEERRAAADEEKARAATTAAGMAPPPLPVQKDLTNIDDNVRRIEQAKALVQANRAGTGPFVGQLTKVPFFADVVEALTGKRYNDQQSLLSALQLQVKTDANEGRLTDNDSIELAPMELSNARDPNYLLRWLDDYRRRLERHRAERLRLYPTGRGGPPTTSGPTTTRPATAGTDGEIWDQLPTQ